MSTPTFTVVGEGGQVPVTLRNYAFEPKRFKFTAGQTVDFVLTSTDGVHTFTVRDLDIDWDSVTRAEVQTRGFTFTRAGEFKLVCTIPSHEGLGMVGTIIVE